MFFNGVFATVSENLNQLRHFHCLLAPQREAQKSDVDVHRYCTRWTFTWCILILPIYLVCEDFDLMVHTDYLHADDYSGE